MYVWLAPIIAVASQTVNTQMRFSAFPNDSFRHVYDLACDGQRVAGKTKMRIAIHFEKRKECCLPQQYLNILDGISWKLGCESFKVFWNPMRQTEWCRIV
jgi:hypothetical protein